MVNIKISRFTRAKKTTEPKNEVKIEPKNEPKEEIKEVLKEVLKEELKEEQIVEPEIKQNEPASFDNIEGDNFLDDLNSLNFKPDKPIEKEVKIKEPKPSKIIAVKERPPSTFNLDSANLLDRIKTKAKTTKLSPESYDDTMFSQNGSEILGRDKRVLLTKIRQSKSLFPDTFKTFKIKVNANIEELQTYLAEMDCMVECENVEQFILDSILQSIKILEGVSSYTKYDIQGLADLLRANKQFHQLSKQLFIKYKIFTALPPEYSLMILVSTSAYICNCKNRRRGEMEAYLNTPINNTQP